jgi:hypothetical protein
MANSFWTDEAGAVSVDWVVVTAAVVGLGLSSVVAVRSGTSSLGDAIGSSLSNGTVVPLRWLSYVTSVTQSFADGNFDGWSMAKQTAVGAWGVMQGPYAKDTLTNPLTYDVTLSPNSKNALIEFDLLILDSWDGAAGPDNPWTPPSGDVLRFQINGQTIATEPFVQSTNHVGYRPGMMDERNTSIEIDGATYNLRLAPMDVANSNQYGSGVRDQKWRVQLEAVNAPQNFQLGYSASVSQGTSNESFGITNFRVNEN